MTTRRISKTATQIAVNLVGLILIAWIVWYFWIYCKEEVRVAEVGGAQEVQITIQGGYDPDVIVVKGDKPVRLHFTARNRRIGRSHIAGAALARCLYRFPSAGYALVVRNPFATRAFLDLVSGRAKYPEVILRLIGTLPAHLALEALSLVLRPITDGHWRDSFATPSSGPVSDR